MSGMFWLWTYRSDESRFYTIGGRHYRCGTVPHTRKYRASRRYYRHPRTTQELRYNSANACDEDFRYHKIRPPRRIRLPTVYDDFWVKAENNRNWKQFRRTRWKPKE
jgi:hypothetical protein